MSPHFRLLAVICCCSFTAMTSASEKPFVAKVNGVSISPTALEFAITEAKATGTPDTPETRAMLIQGLIAEELLWQEAKKQNLHATPETVTAAEAARRKSAIGQYLRRTVTPEEANEASAKRLYDNLLAGLGPQEYRLSVIQTVDEASIRDTIHRLSIGADFTAEARRVSRAPSAQSGGDIGWISFPLPPEEGKTGSLPLAVAQTIATLKPGEVSQPLPLVGGWILLRLDATRPTVIPSYAQAAPALRKAATAKGAQAAGRNLGEKLLKNARIELPQQTQVRQGTQR